MSAIYQVKLKNGVKKGLKQRDLVNEVVLDYFKSHPSSTLADLQQAFPARVQKKLEIVLDEASANKLNVDKNGKTRKQYHVFEGVRLPNGAAIAVCNQWGMGNIDNFLNHARQMGYQIGLEGEGTLTNDTDAPVSVAPKPTHIEKPIMPKAVPPHDEAEMISAEFNEHCLAHRSDLHMLGDTPYKARPTFYYKGRQYFGSYKGHIYRTIVNSDETETLLLKTNQQTAEVEYITKLNESYYSVYGVNRHGIFLAQDAEEMGNSGMIFSLIIANIGFDGSLLGKIKFKVLENEGEPNDYRVTQMFMVDNNLYYIYEDRGKVAAGVRSINIATRKHITIFEREAELDGTYLNSETVLKNITANDRYVYFCTGLNWNSIVSDKYDSFDDLAIKADSNIWLRYDLETKKTACISLTKRSLNDLYRKPETLYRTIYDASKPKEQWWRPNPKFIDPGYLSIVAIDVVKDLMWTNENSNYAYYSLAARNLATGAIYNNIPRWTTTGASYIRFEHTYFDGELMLEAEHYHQLFSIDREGNKTRVKGAGEDGHGECQYMFVEGDYLYSDYNALGRYERINLKDFYCCVEPAPECSAK